LQKACAPPASCAYNDSDANLLAVGQIVCQPTRTVRDMSDLAHAPDATVATVEEVTGSNPDRPPVTSLVSTAFATLAARFVLGSVDLSAKLCRPIAGRPQLYCDPVFADPSDGSGTRRVRVYGQRVVVGARTRPSASSWTSSTSRATSSQWRNAPVKPISMSASISHVNQSVAELGDERSNCLVRAGLRCTRLCCSRTRRGARSAGGELVFWLTRTRSACETGHIVRGRAALERALTLTGACTSSKRQSVAAHGTASRLAQIAGLYDSSRSLR
jgi:hypothetical protein